MQETTNTQSDANAELLKEMIEIARDLQRINSYLTNGQCILAYRHAVALRPNLGVKSEPKQVLEAMIRFIYDGRQVQAEAELKRLGDIMRVAYDDVLKRIKETKSNEAATPPVS
jgi:hypothetical protein